MYEAIEIDGGTAWHKFRYVTLPYLLPFIFLALIFRIVQAFAVFDLVYVLTGGGPGGATETVSVYGYLHIHAIPGFRLRRRAGDGHRSCAGPDCLDACTSCC